MEAGGRLKRKRVSKNKKKSWRKHVNVQDVEDHLEEQRLQERTGGIAADKSDEQLFFVERIVEDEEPVPKKKRKKEPKLLKCHAGLDPDPKIKPVRVKHNIRGNIASKVCKQKREKAALGLQSKKEQRAQQQRQQAAQTKTQKRQQRKVLPTATYDLWTDTLDNNKNEEGADEHYLQVTNKMKRKIPAHHSFKPSGVAAVEVPHPGASCNPAYDEYQELLQKAHEVEVQKDKAERRIVRALDEAFPVANEAPSEATWLSEMSAGLIDDDANEMSEPEGDPDKLSVNPPVRREDKKTLQERKREKLKKEEKKKAELLKDKNVKRNEIFRLKSLKREVAEREKRLEERQKRKEQFKEENKDKPKKLGKMKYEDPDLEVKLTDELVGSLRLLKPEGHLLVDRYKSLQKRNMIEPRQRAKVVRKYKPKVFEKKGHKNVTL